MNIFKRNYKAVVKRGLIKESTTKFDFYDKAIEEENESYEACDLDSVNSMSDHEAEEVADRINVLSNLLIFCGRDPLHELEKVAIKNENRND